MSADWVTAFATVGTFLVILASAIAALAQLRHMRAAQNFVTFELPKRLKDPEESPRIVTVPFVDEYQAIGTVANFFESMGLFVKNGIIDKDIACDFWYFVILRNWRAVAPVIVYARSIVSPNLWTNFEYLASLAARFEAEHPMTYPRG